MTCSSQAKFRAHRLPGSLSSNSSGAGTFAPPKASVCTANWDATPVHQSSENRRASKHDHRSPHPRRPRPSHLLSNALPRGAAVTLRAFESCLRGTCVGRLHAALARDRLVRSTGAASGMPPQQQKVDIGSDPGQPLLPCRFPRLPDWFVRSEAAAPSGGRARRRLADRRLAWRIAEWQTAYFCACEMGWPKDAVAAVDALPRGDPTGSQLFSFHSLVESNLPLSRLACAPFKGGAGRGLQVLKDWISEFEASARTSSGKTSDFRPETLSTVAKPVVHDRIAVMNPAGTVNPSDWLGEDAEIVERYHERREEVADSAVPRACFMVSRPDERKLRHMLLESRMAVLVEESQVPRRGNGALLLAGLFSVPHKEDRDRLIFDRRPQNAGDARLAWASLPLGSQLCQLIVDSDEVVRGSGDDLRTYFYALANAPEALLHSCFGRRLVGSDEWSAYGARLGVSYRLALRVVGMGDRNAVDIAQACHEGVLRSRGCLRGRERLAYGRRFPLYDTLEGLYIDGHFAIRVVKAWEAGRACGRDFEIIRTSHLAYREAGLERAPEKGFGFSRALEGEASPRADTLFTVIGTEVNGEVGRVGSPCQKRAELFRLVGLMVGLPVVRKDLLRRGVALFVHPYMHQKGLMSTFHVFYRWLGGLPEGVGTRWSRLPRAELAMAALLLPLAEADIRLPVSDRISTTDATPLRGGATAFWGRRPLSKYLYRMTEQRGCRTRLTCWMERPGQLGPCYADVEKLVAVAEHHVTRALPCRRARHINLQEIDEVSRELEESTQYSVLGERQANGVDSNVTLGAWAKGRSGSPAVNRALQKGAAWQLFARRLMLNFRLGTAANPSDDPSRLADVRLPVEGEAWEEELASGEWPSELTQLAATCSGESSVPGAPPASCSPSRQFPSRSLLV